MRNNYRSNIIAMGFSLTEFREVIKLYFSMGDFKLIREAIYEENLFQYEKISSAKRITPTIIKRAKLISDKLKHLAIEDTLETAKIINLLAIVENDDMFYTFMNEVIRELYRTNNLLFTKKDINLFFMDIEERDERIANYHENVMYKLKQVYLKVLTDSGLLCSINDGTLIRININPELRNTLIDEGYNYFIAILEGR